MVLGHVRLMNFVAILLPHEISLFYSLKNLTFALFSNVHVYSMLGFSIYNFVLNIGLKECKKHTHKVAIACNHCLTKYSTDWDEAWYVVGTCSS